MARATQFVRTPLNHPGSASHDGFVRLLYHCVDDEAVRQHDGDNIPTDTSMMDGLGLDPNVWPNALRRWKLQAFRELAVVLQPGVSVQRRCANVFRGMLVIAQGDLPVGSTFRDMCAVPKG